ncbi:MAG TPA: hypothetical protein VK200_12835 [Candidatus Limnocylindrales bacterium]|nr:hypothetical protein [Candidatus Limnocylindrales bacterium]
MIRKTKIAVIVALLILSGVAPAHLRAEDVIEKAGVATGVTVGNAIAVPLKAVTMTIGALSGALSFIVTGGNTELTQQIWRDTFEGPYVVTPELARMSVGQRPELELKK